MNFQKPDKELLPYLNPTCTVQCSVWYTLYISTKINKAITVVQSSRLYSTIFAHSKYNHETSLLNITSEAIGSQCSLIFCRPAR